MRFCIGAWRRKLPCLLKVVIDIFQIERQNRIIEILKSQKSVTVKELENMLFFSSATIRRDLKELEKEGRLKRTHGGAILTEGSNYEIPLAIRSEKLKNEKESIGYEASKLVSDGQTLILDSSSTVLHMVNYIKNKDDLTIITNGAKTEKELEKISKFHIYSTGGILRENSLSYIGSIANRTIGDFFADIVFFSCRSVSMERGLSDSNEQEANLRKKMIENSNISVLLCDNSKFDNNSFCLIETFDNIDYLITDSNLSDAWENYLIKKNVKLIYSFKGDKL